MLRSLVGSEMCIRDRYQRRVREARLGQWKLLWIHSMPIRRHLLIACAVLLNQAAVTLAACTSATDCNSVGTCTNSICYCNEWYSGTNCADTISNTFMLYLHQDTYEIDWTAVPSTQPARTSFEYTQLASTWCTCDLTSGACDFRCSCDSDCTTSQLALNDYYEPITNTSSVPRLCSEFSVWNNSMLKKSFNGRSWVYEYDSRLDYELCVDTSNTPSIGWFYNDPGTLSATDTASSISDTTDMFTATPTPTPTHTSSLYQYGDLMSTKETTSSTTGQLRLPISLNGGGCLRASKARFLIDVTNETCPYETGSLSTACTTDLEYTNYFDNLNVATTFTASTLTYVTASRSGNYATAAYTAGTRTCANALIGIAYTVTHDNAGSITAVSAVITTADQTADANTDYVRFDQTFSITFASSSATATPPQVLYSGNLGYEQGEVLLAGTLSTNNAQTAISQSTTGDIMRGRLYHDTG
eukprot:TRINITY_DN13008_c0_g1_i16.p1 TRINITY_DN13008_c0_g1~~TRINITY_DN13008_c0_g1_i16.p1  ORF type:complete len:472 (+),score=95.92 TRINITY_DN13008_c0_g1_i16:124-1539(+)